MDLITLYFGISFDLKDTDSWISNLWEMIKEFLYGSILIIKFWDIVIYYM